MSPPLHCEHEQIRHLIERQFANLTWSPKRNGGWCEFASDFLDGAPLFPAARPVESTTVPDFVSRMQSLSKTSIRKLDERCSGVKIHLYGNVAVAMAVCELVENDINVSRNVEALLLVKSAGEWKIAAQGWDSESNDNPIPADLLELDM